MRDFVNIEKLPGKKHYTGYANGTWHITPTMAHRGWQAIRRDDGKTRYARTLGQLSEILLNVAQKCA